MKKQLPSFAYKLLLLLAPIIWGASFVFMKNAVDVFPPSYLLGVRFTATGLIMLVFTFPLIKKAFSKKLLSVGAILAVLLFLSYWFQTVGLTDTTPGKNAFITGTYCVMVPFLWWVWAKKKPGVLHIVAAFVCLIGLGLVTLDGNLSVSFGDFMTFICAIFNALLIVYINLKVENEYIIPLTTLEFIGAGILGFIVGLFTETWPADYVPTTQFYLEMAYLVILASAACNLIMNYGLKKVDAAPAAIILSLEAVFGALFSVVLYNETVTLQLGLGFGVIFIAIILSEAVPLYVERFRENKRKVTDGQSD
ncbi:MAG: DMT family transporter [Eggerthellaceae bacterium]|nr:DMT family transporter [Eggerthellaceae bacterium]